MNYENNVAVTVCRVESTEQTENFDNRIFSEALAYSIEKLKQGHEKDSICVYNLKIFFSVLKFDDVSPLAEIVQTFAESISLVYTFIPVVKLKNSNTFLSICGIRNQ